MEKLRDKPDDMAKKAADHTDVYKTIFDIVRCVPKGRVTSYGAVAKAAGLKSGARMVGRAMSYTTGVKPKVPVHRVVNSVGILSGEHSQRQKMLEKEGVAVGGGRVIDYKKLFWDPLTELTF
jgi:methylated-DNA-protein-cysteine methyltransferase-like protein